MASTINATTTQGVQVTGDTSGALALQTNNGTTAVTIDTSQNVGIGTSSPQAKLDLGGATSGQTINFSNTGTNGTVRAAATFKYNTGSYAGGSKFLDVNLTGSFDDVYDIRAYTSNGGAAVERMRIDSSGNVLVNTTSQLQAGRFCVAFDGAANNAVVLNDTTAASSIAYMYFSRGGTTRGSITYNGTLVAYNATSDERLKENIVDADSALPTLSKIQVRSFDWIDSKTHETHGVVAQELQKVVPQCVTEGKDNEDGSIDIPWQVDTSPLIPMLVKAIQELKAEVDTLKAQLEAK